MVKVISLSDKAYLTLKHLKGEHDSFSDIVLKLAHTQKRSVMDFAGIWRNNDELDAIFATVEKSRKKFRMREL